MVSFVVLLDSLGSGVLLFHLLKDTFYSLPISVASVSEIEIVSRAGVSEHCYSINKGYGIIDIIILL